MPVVPTTAYSQAEDALTLPRALKPLVEGQGFSPAKEDGAQRLPMRCSTRSK